MGLTPDPFPLGKGSRPSPKYPHLRFRANQTAPISAADPQMGRDGLDVGAVGTGLLGIG